MILLRDEIEIKAPPEKVFDWLKHFKENYLNWHPDHTECRFVKGSSILEIGSVLCVEEYLHGKLHKLKLRPTKVISNSLLKYKAGFGIRGAFEIKPKENSLLFIAEICIGSKFPVLGWIFDKIMHHLLSDRLEALKKHMAEEGENLKRLLENNFF